MKEKEFLTTKELAKRWKMSHRSIQNMKMNGKMPLSSYRPTGAAGHVMYDLKEVIELEQKSIIPPFTEDESA